MPAHAEFMGIRHQATTVGLALAAVSALSAVVMAVIQPKVQLAEPAEKAAAPKPVMSAARAPATQPKAAAKPAP